LNFKKKFKSSFRVLWASAVVWFVTAIAFAQKFQGSDVRLDRPAGADVLPGGGITATDVKGSFIFVKLIPFLIRYAIGLAVGLSVIAFIIGGYQFMTSFGDQEKRKKGEKTIMYAAIGLVLAITAYGIVTVLTSINIGASE